MCVDVKTAHNHTLTRMWTQMAHRPTSEFAQIHTWGTGTSPGAPSDTGGGSKSFRHAPRPSLFQPSTRADRPKRKVAVAAMLHAHIRPRGTRRAPEQAPQKTLIGCSAGRCDAHPAGARPSYWISIGLGLPVARQPLNGPVKSTTHREVRHRNNAAHPRAPGPQEARERQRWKMCTGCLQLRVFPGVLSQQKG
jgi:hypothetical protein